MNIRLNVKDLPEYGLRIIPPNDASFEMGLASSTLPNIPPELIKASSVFVKNTSDKSAVAYMLRWELAYADGKTVCHDQGFSSPPFLMEAWGTGEHIRHQGNNINQNSSRFFTLISPESAELKSIKGYTGAAMDQSKPPQDLDQQFSQEKVVNALSKELQDITSITVSIDGVFFDDGTYVGPDHTNFFARFKADYDARYDLYNEILNKVQSKERNDKVFGYVESLSRGQQIKLQSTKSITSDINSKNLTDNKDLAKLSALITREYSDRKKTYAREIIRHSQRVGIEKAIETIRSRIAKPWAPLRKL